MVLSFKEQFVQPILDGTKIHSIREDIHDRWQPGNSIQMATGVRTKNYNCFNESRCVSTQTVYMSYAYNDIIEITVDGHYLFGRYDKELFAANDGFENWESFFDWFYPLIKKAENEFYVGKLIHWTDKSY